VSHPSPRPARYVGPRTWWLFLIIIFAMGVIAAMLVSGWLHIGFGPRRPRPRPEPVSTRVETLPWTQAMGNSL
jgi:hypothetical protein